MPNQTLMWGAILVALAAIYLMFRISQKAKAQAAQQAAEASSPHDAMLLKFVTDEAGQRKGETVAVDGDAFIVKGPEGFMRVPTSNVVSEGDGLRLTGNVDWDAAKRDGDSWRERSHKVIDYRPDEIPKDDA